MLISALEGSMADAPTPASIERSLSELRASYPKRFGEAATEQALRDEKAKILGPKGALTAVLRQMGSISADARKAIGALANDLKRDVEVAFDSCLQALARGSRDAD